MTYTTRRMLPSTPFTVPASTDAKTKSSTSSTRPLFPPPLGHYSSILTGRIRYRRRLRWCRAPRRLCSLSQPRIPRKQRPHAFYSLPPASILDGTRGLVPDVIIVGQRALPGARKRFCSAPTQSGIPGRPCLRGETTGASEKRF
jgi:hypothetical protein